MICSFVIPSSQGVLRNFSPLIASLTSSGVTVPPGKLPLSWALSRFKRSYSVSIVLSNSESNRSPESGVFGPKLLTNYKHVLSDNILLVKDTAVYSLWQK